MLKRLLIFLFIFIGSWKALAQDPQFSQFYSAPMYLNPAFAGTGSEHRYTINFRNQWPGLPQAFNTYAVSYDRSVARLRSGFGLLVMADRAGSASLTATTIAGSYAYRLQISDKLMISPAVQFAYSNRSMDMQKLVFGDQLDFNGSWGATVDPDFKRLEGSSYFDFSSGVLVYNRWFWAGAAVFHMNEPNQSFLGEQDELPMKTTIHGGVRIPLYNGPKKLDRVSSIAPSFVYKKQGKFNQLDVGMHFHYNPIMIGVWYRGVPIQKNASDRVNHDAITGLFGLRFKEIDFGYSYDFTLSQMGFASGGAHEISLIYHYDVYKKVRRRRNEKFIPCPTW
jgi:type IX secretion system PorP/SprF family membrane protein